MKLDGQRLVMTREEFRALRRRLDLERPPTLIGTGDLLAWPYAQPPLETVGRWLPELTEDQRREAAAAIGLFGSLEVVVEKGEADG